jgi:hypothetical protein
MLRKSGLLTANIYKSAGVHQMNSADPPENRASLSRFTLWCSTLSFYLGNLKGGATTIDFVKDLDINMSNGKARMVLNTLGIPDTDDLCDHMDRVQFANLCASWLQQHIGKQSAKIEASVTRGAVGATFIDCGVPEGYINQRIRQCPKQRGRQTRVTSSIGVDPPERSDRLHSEPRPGCTRPCSKSRPISGRQSVADAAQSPFAAATAARDC